MTTTATPVQAPAIHVQGLHKSYKTVDVLHGVDFDVERGSIFALLGSCLLYTSPSPRDS